MLKILKNNKGFSLIELMIVVVIIGILAAVAIPSYQGFQDKARASEAKVSLSGIYVAEKAYHAEHEKYIANLVDAGVDSLGTLKYFNVGFLASCVIVGNSDIVDTTCTTDKFGTIAGTKPASATPTSFTAGAGRWKSGATAATVLENYGIDQDRTLVGPK